MPTPSIGRVVRYVLATGPCAGAVRAAIVTQAHDDGLVDLTVFPAPGDDIGPVIAVRDIAEDPRLAPLPGTWHWPAVPRKDFDVQATPLGLATAE